MQPFSKKGSQKNMSGTDLTALQKGQEVEDRQKKMLEKLKALENRATEL